MVSGDFKIKARFLGAHKFATFSTGLLISVGGVVKFLTALKICLDGGILSSAHQAGCTLVF